jgi:transcriptional regulator with XRE-family HTH domain
MIDMSANNENNMLGDYLRARRELIQPDSVGLAVNGVRRVGGLRREEIAMLAGISADYYLRLEQGRDRHPSMQVLEALARVLCLDQAATEYLLSLATPRPRHRQRRPRREIVPTGIRQLLDVLGLPAFVEGRYFDVLAANSLARSLSPNLQVGQNRLRAVFLDPAEKALYPDWDDATARLVAGFRQSVGSDATDPRVVQLVGELSLSSERFRRLWARHDVQSFEGMPTRIHHPRVGDFTLSREKLAIGGAEGQLLVVYHAQSGTSSAEKLALLASLTSPTATVARDAIPGHPTLPRPDNPAHVWILER